MKKTKQINKNSLKSLYNDLNHSYSSQIVDVIQKTKMTSNIGNFLMKYKTIAIIIAIIYIALVLLAFHQSPKLILYSILLAVFLIIIMTINSTYKLELLDKGLKLTQLATKELIPYEELFTITLMRDKTRLFLIPINIYKMIIVTTKDKTIRTIELPIIMLRPKQLRDFMNSFEFEIDEKEEEKTQEELSKREKRILRIFIAIVIIILVISIITGIAVMLKRK